MHPAGPRQPRSETVWQVSAWMVVAPAVSWKTRVTSVVIAHDTCMAPDGTRHSIKTSSGALHGLVSASFLSYNGTHNPMENICFQNPEKAFPGPPGRLAPQLWLSQGKKSPLRKRHHQGTKGEAEEMCEGRFFQEGAQTGWKVLTYACIRLRVTAWRGSEVVRDAGTRQGAECWTSA